MKMNISILKCQLYEYIRKKNYEKKGINKKTPI